MELYIYMCGVQVTTESCAPPCQRPPPRHTLRGAPFTREPHVTPRLLLTQTRRVPAPGGAGTGWLWTQHVWPGRGTAPHPSPPGTSLLVSGRQRAGGSECSAAVKFGINPRQARWQAHQAAVESMPVATLHALIRPAASPAGWLCMRLAQPTGKGDGFVRKFFIGHVPAENENGSLP